MCRVWYRLARLIVDLLVLRCWRDRSKDAEILALRHQLAVLHRQVPYPRFDNTDRTLIGHVRQHINLLGYALMVNSLAVRRQRGGRERAPLAA